MMKDHFGFTPLTFGARLRIGTYSHSLRCPLTPHRPGPDCVQTGERYTKNLMTTAGLSAIAQAINWSGVSAQNANMGTPYTQYLLGQTATTVDLYGAVGTVGTAPTTGDTQLGHELGRVVLSAASLSSNSVIWDFFFGQGIVTGTILEVGVFGQASATTNSGTMLDHALISPSITVTSTETVVLEATFQLNQG